jgi:hypothetical protein
MNAGPTSVVKAALVVGQATCPRPSPQPSTPASVQTRTNRESTEVKFIPANAVGAAPMSNGTRMRWRSIRVIFINLVSESPKAVEKLTPLFVGSAITHWYKSTSPLDKECQTFLPSAPTLPTIPYCSVMYALLTS